MKNNKGIIKIVVIYLILGFIWICFSDIALGWLVSEPEIMTRLAIIKGLVFITLTAVFLYFLIDRLNDKINHSVDALREREEQLHFLVKNSSDSLVILNAVGSQRYVSPGAERITGFPIAELEGRSIDTLIHPDDMQGVMEAWQEAVAHPEKTVTVQYRHVAQGTISASSSRSWEMLLFFGLFALARKWNGLDLGPPFVNWCRPQTKNDLFQGRLLRTIQISISKLAIHKFTRAINSAIIKHYPFSTIRFSRQSR